MPGIEKVRVLVADDEPNNLLAYEAILESLDVDLVKATSGEQVLKYLLYGEFAVILLDVQMPGMDGFETATLIRQREKSQQTPLIFATATYKEAVDIFKGYSLGAVDYLAKPIVPEILRSKVSVFVDLFKKTEQVRRQAKLLGAANAALQTEIAEHKRTERELNMARDAADAANRSKSAFLANMSHEIRTPMNGIIGMTDVTLRTDLTPNQRQYLNMVKQSADALLTVINDILDFSKIEAGKLDLHTIDFDLRDNLGHTLKALALRAHAKGLELVCDIAPDVPDALVGDPSRLRQIIVNLVGNAIKFTDQGEVAVEVTTDWNDRDGASNPCSRSATNRLDGPHNDPACYDEIWLHFAVRDSGTGIAANKQQAIFDPFVQADSSTARKYGGTGLGLSISSKLVRMMHGRIWVESTLGCGSTFHFTTRLGVQPGARSKPLNTPCDDLHGVRVVVVDSNRTNRRILEETFLRWQMKPSVHHSGPPALAELERSAARGEAIPLVVLDAVIPGVDGVALADAISRRPALAAARLIMLSTADQPQDVACVYHGGIAACLTKPVMESELYDAVLTALDMSALHRDRTRLLVADASRERRPQAVLPRRLKILLAEDNAVNQTLALLLLEQQGHSVVVAGNGREALAALSRQPFDIVLMDVQMPELDGFETAAAIREQEKETGRHIPIIALTAHAMKGDRERCLDAGMDGYVTKPIAAQELGEAMVLVMPQAGDATHFPMLQPSTASCPTMSPEDETPDTEPSCRATHDPADRPAEAALDLSAAQSRVGGNAASLNKIALVFLEESARLMADIRDAIAGNDAAKLRHAAHSLKGAVGVFGARRAANAALQLESIGRAGDLSGADTAHRALEQELQQLTEMVTSLIPRSSLRPPNIAGVA